MLYVQGNALEGGHYNTSSTTCHTIPRTAAIAACTMSIMGTKIIPPEIEWPPFQNVVIIMLEKGQILTK